MTKKMLSGKYPAKLSAIALFILLFSSCAHSFTGEAAATKALLDLLARKDFGSMGKELINYLTDLCRKDFLTLLLNNPEPMTPSMLGVTRYIIGFLEPVFIFAILASGIYLIFFSGTPGVRTKIKAVLPAVIAAMILVLLSNHILNVMFYVSKLLSKEIVAQWKGNPIDVLLPDNPNINPVNYFMSRFDNLTWYSSDAALPFLYISVLLLGALFTAILARYLIVSLFAMIFPLTIFLYLFAPTRFVGRRLMEQTIVWTFLQVIEAVALLSVVTIIRASAPLVVADVLVIMELCGILILIFVPVAVIVFFRDFLPGSN